MRGTTPMNLEAALGRCGVACEVGRYDGVAVRAVPRWIERIWGSGVEAMTLPKVVYVSPAALERVEAGDAHTVLSHETAHVEQWREHGAIRFVIRYVGDYLRGRAVGLPHHTAYRAIRFEREAREKAEER